MKQLLILLFFPIAGLGQAERIKIDTTGRLIFNEIDSTGTTQINYDLLTKYYIGRSLTAPSRPVMDTARVMIVYCDTTFLGGDGMKRIFTMLAYVDTINDLRIGEAENRFPGVFWKFGYEVSEKRFFAVLQMGKPFYTIDHVAYLDEKGKELSKSIVVIQTIKL